MSKSFLFSSKNIVLSIIKTMKITNLGICNYIYAKPNIDYVNYLSNLPEKLPDTIIKPIQESKQILDFDDKFGLGNVQNPKVILNHLKATNFSYSFDDLKYFLRRIQQLYDQNHVLNFNPKIDLSFKKFVNEIKTRLKNNDHETYPYIGTYAHCFMRLQVHDKELWELLESKIKDDQFYTNFKEVTYACEGFAMLKLFKSQERIDYIYKRLERVVILTIWETNMIYYRRIAEALVEVNRFDSNVFWKLENHIMNNLSMDYETHTVTAILLAFYKSGNGTKDFYNAMQYVLTKGHMFNKNPLLENRLELPFSGKLISNLMEIYSNVNRKFGNFEVEPNFRVMMYKMLSNKKMNYELCDITKIIHYIPVFLFEEENIMVEKIINKIPLIKNSISYEEIQQFLEVMIINNKISMIPVNVKVFIEEYIINQIPDQDQKNIYKIYSFLIDNMLYLNLKALNYKIVEYLDLNLYKLDADILKELIGKIQENDEENLFKNSSFNKINDVLLLNHIDNKYIIEHKKN